jgi:hypothetical protein
MAHPLDEYPIHQVPLSMAYVGTTDKDFYDRNIFHVIPHGHTDMQVIAGFGVYPTSVPVTRTAVCESGRSSTWCAPAMRWTTTGCGWRWVRSGSR